MQTVANSIISERISISKSSIEGWCELATTNKCPLVYGYRLRITNALGPRKTIRFSKSFVCACTLQKTQVAFASCDWTNFIRQGDQSRFIFPSKELITKKPTPHQ